MRIDQITRGLPPRRRRLRVGRGPAGGKGKTCGRGNKGFLSRSGNSTPDYYEGGQMPLYRRVPKRGFRNGPFRRQPAIVNVEALGRFADGSVVGPEQMLERRVVRKIGPDGVKVLGNGEIKVKLTVRAHAFSADARRKIAAAGGTVEVLGSA